MIEMAFEKLSTDPDTQDQLVWLRSKEGGERFPLPIDGAEALAIYLSLTRREMPLPLEHDVTEEILTRLNAKVEEIQILDLDEYGVYTEVVIGFKDGKLRMEVCPGDGIALALKYGAPIFLSEDLTPQASPCREAAAPFEEHPNIPLELSEDPEFEERFEEIDPDGAGYTHLPQAGLLEATELVVFDAIDELLEDSGIDAATGAIELNPDVALEALSSLLAHAVSQEHYEEAKRLRSEISRLEGVRQA